MAELSHAESLDEHEDDPSSTGLGPHDGPDTERLSIVGPLEIVTGLGEKALRLSAENASID